MQDVGALPGSFNTFAQGVNADGTAIAGSCYTADRDHAFRWTANGGMEDLGTLPDAPYGADGGGISDDGQRVAGSSSTPDNQFHAFIWSPDKGMQDLGVLKGGDYSFGFAISRNGAAVTGLSTTASDNGPIEHTFVWTAATGMQDLGAVNADEPSAAFAINATGSVVAGYSGSFAARWVDGQPHTLGTLAGGTFSTAYAIDGSGQIVGGMSDNADGDLDATLWIPSLGAIDLHTVLPRLGVDLTGWHLDVVAGISEDGTTLTGEGTFNGETRAWTLRIPTHGNSTIGTLAAAMRRRR
jgi:probable HAF family extracellular repeat protein